MLRSFFASSSTSWPRRNTPNTAEPVPVIVETPEAKPETIPEPAEPEAYYPPGMDVIVDGVALEHGSVFVDGALCVRLEDLAIALDTNWSWNAGEGGFLWRGQWIVLHEGVSDFRYGDRQEVLSAAPVVYQDAVYVPVKDFCSGLEIGLLQDPEDRTVYVSAAAGVWEIPEGYHVPVIMYHGVTDDLWGMTDLFVRPANLEAQLQYLADNGYTTIWLEDLAQVDKIEKPVLLTFDVVG